MTYKTTEAQREAAKRWRLNNPEKHRASIRKQFERIKASPELMEKRREASRLSYSRHREACIACHQRWRSRPENKAADRLRGMLRAAMKYGLTSKMEEYLCCTIP